MLESFTGWFFVVTISSIIGSCLLLKYFHYRMYWFAFSALIFATLVSLCQSTLFYFIISGAKQLQTYYVFVVFLVLGAAIIYSISLIFSSAAQKRWLKVAGVFTLFMNCILLTTVIGSVNSHEAEVRIALEKTVQWIALAGSLLPVIFILNFLEEIKNLEKESTTIILPQLVESVLGLMCLTAAVLTFAIGLSISSEGRMKLYWQTKNEEESEKFAKLCEERTFTNGKGEALKYLLLKPKDYNPLQKYPLVISLPYGGYKASAAMVLASDANRYRYPAFLFVPFRPEGTTWGGIPNLSLLDSLVFETLGALEKEEAGIDPKRRYVTGVSMGAYGSWHFITLHPEIFAAAIPVCGAGNPQLAANIKDVPVWAFHGAHDRNVPVSGSRDMIDAIKKAGGNPKYTEFPDKAHDIWHDVTQTSGVWDWLFDQKKDSLQSINL